jgi:hypothetical protein
LKLKAKLLSYEFWASHLLGTVQPESVIKTDVGQSSQ